MINDLTPTPSGRGTIAESVFPSRERGTIALRLAGLSALIGSP